ncbi:AzlD domain-containing protein [Minwuia sp.]|uniref:AzlD domain-containing protein n=1 Tax=Minwuia sp. TaxID=2493630 RepID=UPI003A938B73
MTETESGYLAIVMIVAIVFSSRLAGYLLGSRISADGPVRKLFDVLPGCAIAAVIAPVIVRAGPVEIGALLVASCLLWLTSNIGLALASGLLLLIAGSHLMAGL